MDEETTETRDENYADYDVIMANTRITFEDIKAHLTGPVLSICIHIIALALCLTFVVAAPEAKTEVAVEIRELEVKDIEKLPDPPPEEKVEQPPDTTIEVEGPSSNGAVTESTNIGSTTAEVSVGFSDSPDVPVSNVLMIAPSNSPLVLPGVMAGRSRGGRVAALRRHGGSGVTERSLTKGLNWLRDHQNEDGSWGENAGRSPAMTALATLSFLAHGETPSSQEYGTCVLKAIRKLIEFGTSTNAEGLINNGGNGYGHAMVAYALSEAYALTKIPMIEEAMNKTVTRIVSGQNRLGCYDYNYRTVPPADTATEKYNGVPRCDLSVGGWNYQALKAAFAAGCTVKGLETAIETGIGGIKKIHYTGNGFAYGNASGKGSGSYTMTPVGTLCLQLLGQGKSPEAKAGLSWIETTQSGKYMKCDWKEAGTGTMYWALYGWYYQTQALFQGYSGTGGNWDTWNKEFQRALLKEQETDGHWSSPSEKYGPPSVKTGANEAHREHSNSAFRGSQLDLYIYSTSLCNLMLTVYYRYLPTFKVTAGAEGGEGDAGAAKKSEGLKVE
jgi:hypothetical protein